jgi:hypothetical protein
MVVGCAQYAQHRNNLVDNHVSVGYSVNPDESFAVNPVNLWDKLMNAFSTIPEEKFDLFTNEFTMHLLEVHPDAIYETSTPDDPLRIHCPYDGYRFIARCSVGGKQINIFHEPKHDPAPQWFIDKMKRAWDEIYTNWDKSGTLIYVPDTDKVTETWIYEGSCQGFWEVYQKRLAMVIVNGGTKIDIRVGYGEKYEL